MAALSASVKIESSGEGRHKACPYRSLRGKGRGVRGPAGEGRHKACPYGF